MTEMWLGFEMEKYISKGKCLLDKNEPFTFDEQVGILCQIGIIIMESKCPGIAIRCEKHRSVWHDLIVLILLNILFKKCHSFTPISFSQNFNRETNRL